jgi:serine/threonine protein kinase
MCDEGQRLPEVVEIGQVRYLLVERLHAGTATEVYRATEEARPGYWWSIKKLRGDAEHANFQAARDAGMWEFIRPLMLAAHNGRYHDNIVSVRFAQQVGNDFYIVREYCEGSLVDLFAAPGYRGARTGSSPSPETCSLASTL